MVIMNRGVASDDSKKRQGMNAGFLPRDLFFEGLFEPVTEKRTNNKDDHKN